MHARGPPPAGPSVHSRAQDCRHPNDAFVLNRAEALLLKGNSRVVREGRTANCNVSVTLVPIAFVSFRPRDWHTRKEHFCYQCSVEASAWHSASQFPGIGAWKRVLIYEHLGAPTSLLTRLTLPWGINLTAFNHHSYSGVPFAPLILLIAMLQKTHTTLLVRGARNIAASGLLLPNSSRHA